LIIVIDTDVLVSAFLSSGGASREVVRRSLEGRYEPLIGAALFAEYEAVLSREELFRGCPLSAAERTELLDSLLRVCRWTRIYYAWRPNLPDESDNHVLELAISGGAEAIVTRNVRDFTRTELQFPGLRIVTPAELRKE
jgi:putative PIN family toxin of toxin-antitoxin system